jgi:hypothetical protein
MTIGLSIIIIIHNNKRKTICRLSHAHMHAHTHTHTQDNWLVRHSGFIHKS